MATIAVEPADIREPRRAPADAKAPRGRKALVAVGGGLLGVAALAGGAAIVSSVKFPTSLSGLAFLPKPEAPRRSEIRIGRLPDMPEIRNGVPEIVGAKPVRVIDASGATGASFGPKSVAATAVAAASFSTAALPGAFEAAPPSGQLGTPGAAPIRAAAAGPAPVAQPRMPVAATAGVEPPPARAVQVASTEAGGGPRATPSPEPVSTASVPASPVLGPAPAASVPLPPPAPVRSAAAPRPSEPRAEKPARVAQAAARQPAAAVGQPATAAPPEEVRPADDRIEVLGVKFPNGRDVRDAVTSIGEALNLPKVF